MMRNNLSTPYPWDSLDKSVLQRNTDLIRDLSQQSIKTAVIENCQKYLDFNFITPQSILIEKHTLLDVDGAAIIALFKEYPRTQDDTILQITGMARLIQAGNGILPVILLFSNTSKTTLEHECIHLCQWLNSQTYQLTLSERKSIFQQNAEIVLRSVLGASPEQALDLLIRFICYKVWMELEANYFAIGTRLQHRILDCAQLSSSPFASFENYIPMLGIDKDIPNAMQKCANSFTHFCNELESQVEWVRNLVAKSGSKTLHEALWWCKEDFETNMMFGPIEDEDDEDDEDDFVDMIESMISEGL